MDKALEQLARLQDMIASANAGTWEWNVQTGELRLNDVWASLIGYTLAELEPISYKTWVDHVHPDDYSKSNSVFTQLFNHKTSEYKCDIRMRHKQGHWLWMRDTGRVYSRTADGKPEWVIGMHVDITDTKLNQQKIIEQQVTLERAQDIGRLGYWTATPTVEELYWSSKIYKILGLDESKTTPSVEGFRHIVHPEDLAEFDQQMIRLVKGKEFDFEHRIIRPDGTIIWLHERALTTELNGREMFVGTMQNDTDTNEVLVRADRALYQGKNNGHNQIVITDN